MGGRGQQREAQEPGSHGVAMIATVFSLVLVFVYDTNMYDERFNNIIFHNAMYSEKSRGMVRKIELPV